MLLSNFFRSRRSDNILRPDFCVIGAGSGGLSFAAGTAQMGANVILIEKDKMGGDCLNYGCVPSKSLIAAAKSFHERTRSKYFGWSSSTSKVDFKKVQEHIQSVIAQIAPNDSVERFEGLGVKVIKEEGKFIDPDTLKAGKQIIKAKRYIIATGSHAFIPDIPGLDSVNYLTNESIFDIKKQPKNLVIIGGGPIGIEMSQAFARLGSNVLVLEVFKILPKDDPEIVDVLRNSLIKEGVDIKEGVSIAGIKKSGQNAEIHYKFEGKEYSTQADTLLIAAGRRPNLSGLDLEKAKIDFTKTGITVDKFLRTSNDRVFAIGDCTGGYQFTHVAGYHAGLVIRNSIFRLRSAVKTVQIPWVTYTDPEIAHVGFTEAELIDKKIKYQVLMEDFLENDRAHAEHKTNGKIKVLVSPNGNILGATIMVSGAGELIIPWVLAIQNNLNIKSIASMIAPYPTLSEISKKVAGSYFKEKIFSKFMQRLVKFLMYISR